MKRSQYENNAKISRNVCIYTLYTTLDYTKEESELEFNQDGTNISKSQLKQHE